jgi:hypothetical protein
MSDEDTTRIVGRRSSADSDSATTALIGKTRPKADPDADEGHTRLFRPKRTVAASPEGSDVPSASAEFTGEPVVGWLVVVDGPGRGQSLTLGYGMNGIGRGPGSRVPLNFGDEEISRDGHAMLTYDGRNRRFYIQHGGGVNLTYVGDVPVLQPRELVARDVIGIGNTKLCFVPLCGPEFDWG